ncbi:MAG TPA: family 16 glycoside hydrolase [Planctomycetaceae bacterium]|nr:family 16 glycoside hydrolase [Planctomycetaceae bacterium]
MADASPDLALAEQIDAIGDQFERDFCAGQQPRLEQFLAAADEQLRPTLFRTLLELELELRQKAGEQPQIAEYETRFPEQLEQIRQAFEAASRPASMVSSVKLTGVDTSKGQVPAKSAVEAAAQSAPKTLGRFEILSVLGEGAFGTVYRARDPQLDREVAVKVPKFAGQQSREDRERFLREARAAANLHHPQICAVHEVGTIDGRDYIVLAFIDGKPLSKVLQSKPQLSDRQIVAVIRKLALALQEAHDKGIIHRDLKPANIMINRKGEPVIMDFGLARRENSGDVQISHSGQIMGTPAYMSPEQARGDGKAVGPAADIYSLGVVLYELLCGRRPFEGTVTEVIGLILHVEAPPPSEFRPTVDPRLQAICLKAISKKPQERYASMKEFATALADYVKAAPSTTRPADAAKAEPESADELHTTQFAQLLAAMSSDVESKVERAVRRAGHPPKTPWWTYLAGSGFMGLVILLGVIFFIKSGDTTVIVQISIEKYVDDLKDPALSFLLDNKPVEAAALESPIELKPGEHELIVNRDGKLFKRFAFNVEIGASKNEPVVVQDVTPHQNQDPLVAQDVKLRPNQDPLIGEWEWGWGDIEPDKEPIYQNEITIHADGTCVLRIGGLSGKWERSGNQVVINWANNAKDTVTVSKDGTKLDGSNKEGTMSVRGRKKRADGWTSLFNGKDLTGWKMPPGSPPNPWKIENGILTAATGSPPSMLVTERGDYRDVHIRAEARLESAIAGIKVRTPLDPSPFVPSYTLDLIGENLNREQRRIAMLKDAARVSDVYPTLGAWTSLEVMIRGFHVQVLADGKVIDEYDDPQRRRPSGHIGLARGPNTRISFRKIEVKELASEPPSPGPAAAGWTDLFNGKDLTGWQASPSGCSKWELKDGVVSYRNGPRSHLLTVRSDYGDFHLRGEFRLNRTCNSGVWFWCQNKGADYPIGYEVELSSTQPMFMGSVLRFNPAGWQEAFHAPRDRRAKPDVWIPFEVTIQDGRVTTRINGMEGVSTKLPAKYRTQGHIALQCNDKDSVVEFRKLQIQEMTAPAIPADRQVFNGHSYKFFPEQLSWKVARARCEAIGGHLVILETPAENAFVAGLVSAGGKVDSWIGATDEGSEGKWRWVDGRDMTWTNWFKRQKQPNNKGGVEHFGVMSNKKLAVGGLIGWEWTDQPSESLPAHQPGYVCEWDALTSGTDSARSP